MRATPLKLSFSGNATSMTFTSPCYLHGFLLGMDGTNDPTITFVDVGSSTVAATDTEVVPTNTYDASALGLNGFTSPMRIYCSKGIAVVCALGGGACEVTVFYSPRPIWQTA